MSDKSLAMILATAIAAPAMIVCCGGGVALIASAVAGSIGFLSGSGVLSAALIAMAAGITLLAMRRWRQTRRSPESQIEEQV